MATVLTPEERTTIIHFKTSGLARPTKHYDDFLDDEVYTIERNEVTELCNMGATDVHAGSQYDTVGGCVQLFTNKGSVINGTFVVRIDDFDVLISSSLFEMAMDNGLDEAESVHTGFAKIMKILNVTEKMGRILVTEPNKPEDLTPGVIEYNKYTENVRTPVFICLTSNS